MSKKNEPQFHRPVNLVDTSEVKAPRFVCLSMLLHGAGLAALLFISATSITPPESEEVMIELTEMQGAETTVAGEALAEPNEGAMVQTNEALPALPLPVAELPRSESKSTTPPVAKVEKAEVKATPAPVVTKAPVVAKEKSVVPTAKAEPAVRSEDLTLAAKPDQETVMAENVNLDDIEAPELSEPISKVVTHKEAPLPPPVQSDDRLKEVEANALSEFEKELNQNETLTAAEQAAKALEEKNKAEQAAIAARLAAVRQENEKALATKGAPNGAGTGNGTGLGQQGDGGNANGNSGKTAAAGVAGGVRSLEKIRQMPGNPRPTYSEEERLQRQQGDVVFLAYIGKDGRPMKFKQMQSTGYPSLDQKTLAALQQWKFYPGQEGWVEIPFRWDIRGGPQELSALNRRKLSQKVD